MEPDLDDVLNGLFEKLAAIEHSRWAHWQRYVHSKGVRMTDGSLMLPPGLVAQWDRQIATTYENLDDQEKDSDREQVQKYLPLISAALNEWVARR
jgi:hypothetical protein